MESGAHSARPKPATAADADESRPPLWHPRLWLLAWTPVAIITLLHYGTGPDAAWAHDILRRMYYLPILFSAFVVGLRGGLVAAAVVSVAYLPHAFLHSGGHHVDPGGSIDKSLELVLYFVMGGVAGYLADLERTRRAQLSRALEEQRQLTKQLARAGRLSALGEVVAGIAHEIKNPLHALAGSAEIVDAVVPEGAEERRLWEIHRSELKRLERVAERFLSFARPAPSRQEPLDLREVGTRVHELVASDARQKGVEVQLVRPGQEVPVIGDRDQLAQVGLNIVLNALRALKEAGGQIHICVDETRQAGRSMACLRIENSGPAIPEAEIEQLFDPFYSGSDGTGLGLSISARIAEQHDGYIEAANGGIGVVFTLLLPSAASSDA